MTNNIQHQDTETSIHKIQPNQIIKAQQENDLTYWKGTTEKLSKLECNLALNRDYTTAEYLSTVKDCKLRRQMTRYRLSNHTLSIETGRYHQHWLPKESRICPYCTHGEVERERFRCIIFIFATSRIHKKHVQLGHADGCRGMLINMVNGNRSRVRA